jgi:hypothetical protein
MRAFEPPEVGPARDRVGPGPSRVKKGPSRIGLAREQQKSCFKVRKRRHLVTKLKFFGKFEGLKLYKIFSFVYFYFVIVAPPFYRYR